MYYLRNLTLAAALVVPVVASAIPTTLTHQGRLMDSTGAPLEGATNVTFTIYDQANGGSSVFTETQSVSIDNGYFNATLGSSTPLVSADVQAADELWLEIAVDGNPPLERIQISSVPSALAADVATSVSGGIVDASEIRINGQTVIDDQGQATLTVSFADLTDVPSGLDDGDDDSFADYSNCPADNILVHDGSQWQCTDPATLDISTAQLVGTLDPVNIPFGDGENNVMRGDRPDADTLGALNCNAGDIAVYNSNSAAWECGTASDSDTLAQLSCGDGESPSFNETSSEWECSPNDTLASLDCADGELARFNETDGAWECVPEPKGGSGALLAGWELNESNGDEFANRVDDNVLVAPFGGLIAGSQGHSSRAVLFSGGVLEVAADNTIGDSPYITTEAWIQPESSLSGTKTILHKVGGYQLQQVDGKLAFTVTAESGECTVTSNGSVELATWHHVAGSYNGREIMVSIDDIKTSKTCQEGPVTSTAGEPFYVGAVDRGRAEPYRGVIDEIRLWSTSQPWRSDYGDIYTRWGFQGCPSGDRVLYNGLTFGAHHNHHNSGNMCLAPSDPGPSTTSSGDILYPVSIDHNNNTSQTRLQLIDCAVCMAPTSPCFTIGGTDSCPSGFATRYQGIFFGGHYSHAGGGDRICIENGANSGKGNSGDYIYVTAVHDAYGSQYPATRAVKCATCCAE